MTLLLGASSGCVRVYQPLSGLHAPVVVDPQAANLTDVRVTIHCVPGDLLGPLAAANLCRKVGVLFENQGAVVDTVSSVSMLGGEGVGGDVAEGEATAPSASAPTDLQVELRARKLHEAKNPLLWLLCVGTFTIVPYATEFTFAQDVVIRDGTGFLLLSDSLEGRIVEQTGIAMWLGNKLLDATWRTDEDKLTGNAINEDLSADLYKQLSQLVFNAKMRWQVLQEMPPAEGAG